MTKYIALLLTILIGAIGGATTVTAADDINRLADEVYDNLLQYYPVLATEKGVHDYDHLLTDYSSGSVRKEKLKLKDFEKELRRLSTRVSAQEDRINLRLLKSNLDLALFEVEKRKPFVNNPYRYAEDIVNGIYLILVSEHAPIETRAAAIIGRLNAIPAFLRRARKNIKEPAPLFVTLASETIAKAGTMIESVGTGLPAEIPNRALEIKAAAETAAAALTEFDTFLAGVTAGPPGSFAIGKSDFNYLLRTDYFLDFDSDSLLAIGETMFARTDSALTAYTRHLDSLGLEADSVYVLDNITRDQVLDYYGWELEQVIAFLKENDLMTIPDDIGRCHIVETPPFLQNVISSYAYQMPGSFNPYQDGQFFVYPIPSDLDSAQLARYNNTIQRRRFRGPIVHEAFPGHHFQLQMAARQTNRIRKWQENISFIEGWALYCEEMMYHQGLYRNPRQYLTVLWLIKLRAARVILDVKLQTGQISLDEATAWLADKLDTSPEYARIEVNRYALEPAAASSYLIGKLEIMKIRDVLQKQDGAGFSLKAFHDRLLGEGSVPPPLLRDIWDLTR